MKELSTDPGPDRDLNVFSKVTARQGLHQAGRAGLLVSAL